MTADPVTYDDDGHPIVPVIRWANVAGVPPTVDTEALDAWAAETIPKLAAVFHDMAEAVRPLMVTMAQVEAAQQRRHTVPFWTEQPNRSRRTR